MLFYYKLTGLNAIISIVVNLLILLGLMAYLGATMTLPGIAGFILTIGMGVDSNVLIFERIKEELATAAARARPSTPASTACGGRSSTRTSRRSSRRCCCCSSAPGRSAASPSTLIIGLVVERVHCRVRLAHGVRAGAVASARSGAEHLDAEPVDAGCKDFMQIFHEPQLQLHPLALARHRAVAGVIIAGVGRDRHARPAARHRLLGRHAGHRAVRAAGHRRPGARARSSGIPGDKVVQQYGDRPATARS